ncbi:hypothetical protein AMTRI_Chr13g90080 [Amborella trichopoda]|uniref:pentatricopeptide repeat-containing protein At2g42920, chloroplastic-like n=1 Tax=Amborella trichopoda TaxID=13333 RepID=UPI0009BF9690|nr:pentatricopeptide repeat-containing protein At2g42920, chloroplastic-like [Amborella trichopoda]|eukprot:XP_011626440.2 pentatricopeptide repeat-containing protein At2g42920, chloroplastic-like [Amborella trichopoda]
MAASPPCKSSRDPLSPPIFTAQNPSLSSQLFRNSSSWCHNMRDLKQLHAHSIKTGLIADPIAASQLLAFCATSPSGSMPYALSLFAQIDHPNSFIYNTLIRGHSLSSTPQNALCFFQRMLDSSDICLDRRTYPSLFQACAQLSAFVEGAQLHGQVIKFGLDPDAFIQNTIIHFYASLGLLRTARQIFRRSSNRDVVSWNSLIVGCAKWGLLEEARQLFDEMPVRSTVSWNAMIACYVHNGRFMEALRLFREMQEARIEPTVFTMVSLLSACAQLGALEQGEWIHKYTKQRIIGFNPILFTAIVDMYSKCGNIDKALAIFESGQCKPLSSWNSMIAGLAMHGRGKEAIGLFSRLEFSGLKPDNVTFIGVLSACNHAGLVEEGREYFLQMQETYKIIPDIKHHGCIVDILGRAGLLKEAEELIENMPIEPDIVIWGSLLSACRNHGDVEIGERAARRLSELDPWDSCGYILLSNIYAAKGRYRDALSERKRMKEKKVRKKPGCSLIELDGVVHEFIVGERCHLHAEEIYTMLRDMAVNLREEGYASDPNQRLMDNS